MSILLVIEQYPFFSILIGYFMGALLIGYPMGWISLQAMRYPSRYPYVRTFLFPFTSEHEFGSYDSGLIMPWSTIAWAFDHNDQQTLERYKVIIALLWPLRVFYLGLVHTFSLVVSFIALCALIVAKGVEYIVRGILLLKSIRRIFA